MFFGLNEDKTFKYVFKEQKFLIYLLEALSNITKISVSKNFTSHIQMPIIASNSKIKDFYGDIVVVNGNTDIISIEMYNCFEKEQYKKSLAYATRLYSRQFKKNDNFSISKRVISINLIKNNYKKNNNDDINGYGFMNLRTFKILDDELLLYLIRIDKLATQEYNKNNKKLILICKLLMAKSIEEMKAIAKGEIILENLVKYVSDFISDPENIETFSNHKIELYQAEKRGKMQGKKLGERNTTIHIANNMYNAGMPIGKIIKITGLKKEDLKELLQNNSKKEIIKN